MLNQPYELAWIELCLAATIQFISGMTLSWHLMAW